MTDEKLVHILVKAMYRPYTLCRKIILIESTHVVTLDWAKEKFREEQIELQTHGDLGDAGSSKKDNKEKAYHSKKNKKHCKKNIKCFDCHKMGRVRREIFSPRRVCLWSTRS